MGRGCGCRRACRQAGRQGTPGWPPAGVGFPNSSTGSIWSLVCVVDQDPFLTHAPRTMLLQFPFQVRMSTPLHIRDREPAGISVHVEEREAPLSGHRR